MIEVPVGQFLLPIEKSHRAIINIILRVGTCLRCPNVEGHALSGSGRAKSGVIIMDPKGMALGRDGVSGTSGED